jgi:hypothetical protein
MGSSGRPTPSLAWLLVPVAAGALTFACGVNTGDSTQLPLAETAATQAPTATWTAMPTPPPATPTLPPGSSGEAAAPTATPLSPKPDIDCPGPPRYHLSIEKLQAQPGLAGAIITEVDIDTIRIDIQGVYFLFTGWGEHSSIGGSGTTNDQLFEQVVSALDAVLFEC